MEEVRAIHKQYQEVLRGEANDINAFTQDIQDTVFDYFNMIVKEYLMTIDKWGSDPDYVAQIKEEYVKIDKELEEENKAIPLPQELSH